MATPALSEVERRARRLLERREKRAALKVAERIVYFLNFPQPVHSEDPDLTDEAGAEAESTDPAEAVFDDKKTGMDIWTFFECKETLHELADTWLAAGCQIDAWPLRAVLLEDIASRPPWLSRRPHDGRPELSYGRTTRYAGDSGFGDGFQVDSRPGYGEGVALFKKFITSPLYRSIGRCEHCPRYYVNTSGHADKKFCSGRCARAHSATKSTREIRQAKRDDKLQRVQAALREFESLPPSQRARLASAWKPWVAARAGLDLTVNFVTRCINQGGLKAPALAQREDRK